MKMTSIMRDSLQTVMKASLHCDEKNVQHRNLHKPSSLRQSTTTARTLICSQAVLLTA